MVTSPLFTNFLFWLDPAERSEADHSADGQEQVDKALEYATGPRRIREGTENAVLRMRMWVLMLMLMLMLLGMMGSGCCSGW